MKRILLPVLVLLATSAAPAFAEDDGEEFLGLLRRTTPKAKELAQRYIDNAANKWEGRIVCTPEENREEARRNAVVAYFESHPTEMWRPQRYLIMQGLMAAFPCEKKS